MSAISTRLLRDTIEGVVLNAGVFGAVMISVMIEDDTPGGGHTVPQARDMLNNHLANNGYPPLTAAEEADLGTMRVFYGTLAVLDKSAYRDKLPGYSSMLQGNEMTEADWDRHLGL